jgi:hypothetical protein
VRAVAASFVVPSKEVVSMDIFLILILLLFLGGGSLFGGTA